MPFNRNSRSSQFNITKGFSLHWPNLVLICLNLRGVCLNKTPENGKNSTKLEEKIENNRLKAIAHWVWNFRMRFSVFSYSSSFPIKTHATDAKTQKIEPDPNFFWRTKVSEAVCKCDWHNVRSYLFFKVRKFRTKISDSVCRDLYCWVSEFLAGYFF